MDISISKTIITLVNIAFLIIPVIIILILISRFKIFFMRDKAFKEDTNYKLNKLSEEIEKLKKL